MLKKIVVILLMAAFAGQIFNKSILFMSYYANPAAFAEKCINKTRPMMHCNGKCQVMKKMQEEERKEKEDLERKAENKVEFFSRKPFAELPEPVIVAGEEKHYIPFIAGKPVHRASSLFHPPALA